MKIVNSNQMKEIECKITDKYGVPTLIMMESAAHDILDECLKSVLKRSGGIKETKATIACGIGNNGGDGFALARLMTYRNIEVSLILVGDEDKMTEDCRTNMIIARNIGIPLIAVSKDKIINDTLTNVKNEIEKSDLVIDSLFGTGLGRNIEGVFKNIIEIINQNAKFVISVDIPSGINADNGHVMGLAVNADKTVTFGLPKTGLYLYQGAEYAGEIIVRNSFVPKELIEESEIKIEISTDNEISAILPKRENRSNKGSHGKVYVFAGCNKMPGAAIMSSEAAYKVGCGLVNACVTKEVARAIQYNLKEAVTTILPDKEGSYCIESFEDVKDTLKESSAILLGPGISQSESTFEFVYDILSVVGSPVVIDADALNIISKDLNILKNIKTPFVITPHPGEMSRLTGKTTKEILDEPIKTAQEFSREFGCVTVLKDARIIVSDQNGNIYINITGNNSLAKAGTGDVLAGMITGFISQGVSVFNAAKIGTYIHGKAGQIASKYKSKYGVMATDLLEYIPLVLNVLSTF